MKLNKLLLSSMTALALTSTAYATDTSLVIHNTSKIPLNIAIAKSQCVQSAHRVSSVPAGSTTTLIYKPSILGHCMIEASYIVLNLTPQGSTTPITLQTPGYADMGAFENIPPSHTASGIAYENVDGPSGAPGPGFANSNFTFGSLTTPK